MNIITELDKEQSEFQIHKVEIQIGHELIDVDFIVDCEINYDHMSDSNISFTFMGITPQLLDTHMRVNYIKIYGVVRELKNNNKQKTFIWNIPCDMRIEDLDITGNNAEPVQTYVNFVGDMW